MIKNKKFSIPTLFFWLPLAVGVLVNTSCSTSKDSAMNRGFHQMNAKYNGFFNAREILKENLNTYWNSYVDNFEEIIPLEVYPDEDAAIGMKESMEDAISRLNVVIYKHSMPSPMEVRVKDEEFNKWIDENWLVMGQAYYYQRDFPQAQSKFEFVYRSYPKQSSLYDAILWLARLHLENGNKPEAKKYLKLFDLYLEKYKSNIESQEKLKHTKTGSKKRQKNKKDKLEEDLVAEVRDEQTGKYFILQAKFSIAEKDYAKAVEHLQAALEFPVGKRYEKARANFVLAQLLEKTGDEALAKQHYKKAARLSKNFDMQFHAKLFMLLMDSGTDSEKLEKKLLKMAKDDKNEDQLDKIYYILAKIKFKAGEKEEGIAYLQKSARSSTINKYQKSKSYLELAQLFYGDRKFVDSKYYFDSAVVDMPDDFPNKYTIKKKGESLENLVKYHEIVIYEDSVQSISEMPEDELEKFIKDLIQKEREEAELKAQLEKEALLAKQGQINASKTRSGSSWYFHKRESMERGAEEFNRIWGQRDLEDNWRRSNKQPVFQEIEEELLDTGAVVQLTPEQQDSVKFEEYKANLPFSAEARDSSNTKLTQAHFQLGMIYYEDLKELKEAIPNFKAVIDISKDPNYVLPSAYTLYLIYKDQNSPEADTYKNYIFTYYPNSEIAEIIRDPEGFKERQQSENDQLDDYLKVLARYDKGQYQYVIAKCKAIVKSDKPNPYKAKYYLLMAFAKGYLPGNPEQTVVPVLEDVIEKFPGTEDAAYAQRSLDALQKVNDQASIDPADFDFTGKTDDPNMFCFIVYRTLANANEVQAKVADFNENVFRSSKYKTELNPIDGDVTLITVKGFENKAEADRYVKAFEIDTRYTAGLNKDSQYFVISKDDYLKVYLQKMVTEYTAYYAAIYKDKE